MVRVKDLVTGHHRHKILRFRQIDDVVGPAGNHVDSLDLVPGNLKLHRFAGVDVSLLNQTVTSDHNEQLPLGVVPVLPLGNARTADVDAHLSAVGGVHQLGERATVVHVHLQGILELAGIPYVGCGVVASAVSMDKLFTKVIVNSIGNIRQARYVAIRRRELENMDDCVARVESVHKYPVFIKPSNAGSSKGVSKAHNRGELISGLKEAAVHDEKILVEETIVGREIECAVLGGDEPKASGVGEILAAADFYDFDAKYNNAESKTVVGPDLPAGKEDEIRKDAVAIFNAVDGFGLARIDFFLENGTNDVVFNELNTMPGFTSISMYPMLWANKGLDKKTLVDKLIRSAFNRHK